MRYQVNPNRVLFERDTMLYGHFLEHFHRQIYGGVYDPASPLSDARGFRTDVIEALRQIRTPVIRWPGGCFVSSYHWRNGVGKRVPSFDKAWRVEDSNQFGTDEFVELCRAIECEPYFCTNAGTGTPEEMSDWVEYCNLKDEGEFARMRIAGGHKDPYGVKYWSVGNENYGSWEIGAKGSDEWSRIVLESAKMIHHVDPFAELSAAALDDLDWNVKLLKAAGPHLHWISIHGYWDGLWQVDEPADYGQVMAETGERMTGALRRVRGLLDALGLTGKVKITYDEWNLRGWHHPNAHTVQQGRTKADYLYPRDRNDLNSVYTMADAVFSACFLSMLLRNADAVGMACFAPVVNTRGCIYVHEKGIVKRPTFHVFDMYANLMGDEVLDGWMDEACAYETKAKDGTPVTVGCVDALATKHSKDGRLAIALINKHEHEEKMLTLDTMGARRACAMHTLRGDSPDAYNDVHAQERVRIERNDDAVRALHGGVFEVRLPPHSVSVLVME